MAAVGTAASATVGGAAAVTPATDAAIQEAARITRERRARRAELGHVAVALNVGRRLQALDDSRDFWPEDCSTLAPWAFIVPERLPGLVRDVHRLFAIELREWAKQAGRDLLEWPSELKDLREFFDLGPEADGEDQP